MRTPREPVQDTLPGHAAVVRVPLLRRAAPDQAQRVVRRLAGQLPFFAAASADPIAGDLSGLLIGPGQVVRMGGTARVSIVVDAPWRVHALAAEFRLRGLGIQWEPSSVEGHFGVRTSYSGTLSPLSALWLRGAVKAPPAGFLLDGLRLRLWFTGAGSLAQDGTEALLRVGTSDELCWKPAVKALDALGLPVDPTPTRGAALRVSGRRRIRRLAELIGEPITAVPKDAWPTV
jgi:hypothetical protein